MTQQDKLSDLNYQAECVMGKLDKSPSKLARIFIKLMENLMAVALMYMAVIIFAQIVFRELGHPLSWSEETGRIASLWLTLIGAYLVARQNTHLKVEAFTDFLKGKPRLWLNLFINLVSVICAAILTYYGTTITIALWTSVTPAAEIPFPFLFAATIIGSGLMLIYFVFETFNILRETFRKTGDIK
jgi:TRAP-type C4-dicarboxylate transport system permease small subunit